jgi:hypothetical protein
MSSKSIKYSIPSSKPTMVKEGENKKSNAQPETSLIRSSAAEYLTFVAAGGNSEASVEMRYEDENIWLTQKMMAALYDVSVPAINQHLKRIFRDNELEESSVVKQYLTTAADGKNYQTKRFLCCGSKQDALRRAWPNGG